MIGVEQSGLILGAVALGFVHGIEPGHGWPVAASYALEQSNKWLYGFASGLILGVGHLVSSIAMVAVFFWAKAYFDLTQVNDPIVVGRVAGYVVEIGGPVGVVAGAVLILLGIREYRGGHHHDHGGHSHDGHHHGDDHHDHGGHSHDGHHHGDDHHDHGGHSHDHSHDGDRGHSHDRDGDHGHSHDHGDSSAGLFDRVKQVLPFVGDHAHPDAEEAADRGLWGIAGFAFLLGFAHEEEFEIIAICAGTEHCLSLMAIYAVTVIVGIVGLTLLLIAGYERFEDRAEQYAEYLPAVSAAVLIVMGAGFVLGVL